MPSAWIRSAGALLNRLTELVPSVCALCGSADREPVCEACWVDHLSCRAECCRQCAAPLPREVALCGACLAAPPAFDATVAVAAYAAPVDRLVLALKFEGQLALAPFLGRLVAQRTWEALGSGAPDILVPVPLGPARLAARGFNQSLEIARGIGGMLHAELAARDIRRVRETDAQTLLAPDQRRVNLRGAFAGTPGSAAVFGGRHVGVVDDVMTTGTTLQEMALVLKALGASRITNLVVARTAARP